MRVSTSPRRTKTTGEGLWLASRLYGLFASCLRQSTAIAATAQAAPGEQGCDPLDPAVCLQPWPNDYFTVADPTTDTGRRLDLDLARRCRATSPATRSAPTSGTATTASAPARRSSPRCPGSTRRTPSRRPAPCRSPTSSAPTTRDQPIVVINADTRQRHLIWSELDANPTDPANVNLIIRPGGQLRRGRALHRRAAQPEGRGGQDDQGAAGRSAPTATGCRATDAAVEARRPHMERHLPHARSGRASRATSLYLAWDFTVASERNLSERALYIRDDAFAAARRHRPRRPQVQGSAPQFTVTRYDRLRALRHRRLPDGEDNQIARNVEGKSSSRAT